MANIPKKNWITCNAGPDSARILGISFLNSRKYSFGEPHQAPGGEVAVENVGALALDPDGGLVRRGQREQRPVLLRVPWRGRGGQDRAKRGVGDGRAGRGGGPDRDD